jgi:hypothetical protein
MNFPLKALLFVAGLAALIIFQVKVVTPLVMQVVKSDLFLTDSQDLGGVYSIENELTDFANMHCSHYISEDLGPDANPVFSDKAINAWDIGNHTYIINSELEMTQSDGTSLFKTYICRISYAENTDPTDYKNWSVYGVSGLD